MVLHGADHLLCDWSGAAGCWQLACGTEQESTSLVRVGLTLRRGTLFSIGPELLAGHAEGGKVRAGRYLIGQSWSYLKLVICPAIGPELLSRHAEGGKARAGRHLIGQRWYYLKWAQNWWARRGLQIKRREAPHWPDGLTLNLSSALWLAQNCWADTQMVAK